MKTNIRMIIIDSSRLQYDINLLVNKTHSFRYCVTLEAHMTSSIIADCVDPLFPYLGQVLRWLT